MRCIVTTLAKLRLYVDLRMYDELDAYADDCIRDKGWKLLLSRMKKVRDKGDSLDAFRPESVAPGKVRDAIVHLLALDAVKGIDIDLLQTFRNLKPSSLRHLRSLVIPIAIKALEEQIQKHNTFFMDIEEMATTAYAVLVQDIVNSRNEEITSIGSNPSVLQVLSSYYGFSILTLGSNIQRRHQWEAPGAAEALKEVTKSLGATVRFIQSKPIIQAQKVFKNCTEETANLLANIARMAVHMGISTQTNSLNKLKNQGDSRTIPFLLAKLERVRHYRVKNSLQEALAGIGGETIVDILVDSYPSYNATRIKAMGRIRSERTIKILEDIVKSRCSQERKSAAIWGLGNLDALDSVDVIEMHLTSKNQKVKTASIRALMKLGPDGHKHILENLDSMIGTLSRETYTHTILQGLVKIPKIRDSKEFVKSISSSLLKAYEKDSQRKNSRTRTYWERQRMLRRTAGSTPRQILDALRGFPKLLGNPQIIDTISRMRPSDLAPLLVPGYGITHEFRERIIDLVADRIQKFSNPLQVLSVVADLPYLMKVPMISEVVIARRKEIQSALYRSYDIIEWLKKIIRVPALDDEGIVADAFLALLKKGRLNRGSTSLPSLILALNEADVKQLGDEVPAIIAESLDEPWVYEAVLVSKLQHHPIIKEALISRIETTFFDILQKNYHYTRWILEPWFKEELAIFINQLDDPSVFTLALQRKGYFFKKSAFTRIPRIEAKA